MYRVPAIDICCHMSTYLPQLVNVVFECPLIALLLRYNLKNFIYRKFVPQCPIEILKTGNFNKMPIMIGQTKDEGALFSSKFITDPNCLQYLDKYFDALTSILLFNKTGNFGEEGNVSKILKVMYILLNCSL